MVGAALSINNVLPKWFPLKTVNKIDIKAALTAGRVWWQHCRLDCLFPEYSQALGFEWFLFKWISSQTEFQTHNCTVQQLNLIILLPNKLLSNSWQHCIAAHQLHCILHSENSHSDFYLFIEFFYVVQYFFSFLFLFNKAS